MILTKLYIEKQIDEVFLEHKKALNKLIELIFEYASKSEESS